VYYSCILFFFVLLSVHLCAIVTRFNKCNLLTYIVTVSVIHCWLYSSTNHNSARCHLTNPPPRPPSVYSVTQSEHRQCCNSTHTEQTAVCIMIVTTMGFNTSWFNKE